MTKSVWLIACLSTCALAQSPPPAAAPVAAPTSTSVAPASDPAALPPSLADLFSEATCVDAAISPSGQYLAAIVRRPEGDLLMLYDFKTNQKKVIQKVKFAELAKNLVLKMSTVYWKSDDRVLLRLAIRPADGVEMLSDSKIARLGDRLLAMDRDGSKIVGLLSGSHSSALEGAFNLGAIGSFLPRDPKHILMVLDGFNGRSLFKVDLETGAGEQIERPNPNLVGWWLDLDGNPVVRATMFGGAITYSRKEGDKWEKFHVTRIREMKERADYEFVGASDQEGKYYVLARPEGHDRIGLYLYDLEKNVFGDAIIENPQYDLTSAAVTRDGTKVRYYCYIANVEICEFSDAQRNGHMRAIRKYFEESANVTLFDSSEDSKTFVLFVEGPSDPPGYFYYLVDKRSVDPIGTALKGMEGKARPATTVVRYKARDGKELVGYLTKPANVPPGTKLPLVMYPHGGPEMRDHLTFDPWVQYFVSRGYAVYQPNFRGSDGYGKQFAESGYGEWGRKMQDDITDGLKDLADRDVVDPARVCIVGASYGGYAALAGASLTPDVYKCAVSVAGISDLDDFIGWRKKKWGRDSEGYTYWLKAIGNPETDKLKLSEVSPLDQVAKIHIPVLLMHGSEDDVVPFAQSKAMKKALDKAGSKTELIELEGEGHSYWSSENEMYALSNIGAFLWKNLGAGFGVSAAPEVRPKPED